MQPERIAALLTPFLPHPGDALLQQLSTYLDLLLHWNAKMNLTAVRDPEEIVTRHFGESLFAAAQLFHPTATQQLLDIGSGAGFPGLPVRLYAPHLRLTLIESTYRKAIFIREVVRALQLEAVSVFAGRAEDFPPPASSAPLTVTLRAVERFEAALRIAARFLSPAPAAKSEESGEGVPGTRVQPPGTLIQASGTPEEARSPRNDTGGARTQPAERTEEYSPGREPEVNAAGATEIFAPASRRLALLVGMPQVERARALLPQLAWADPVLIPESRARVLLVAKPRQESKQ